MLFCYVNLIVLDGEIKISCGDFIMFIDGTGTPMIIFRDPIVMNYNVFDERRTNENNYG